MLWISTKKKEIRTSFWFFRSKFLGLNWFLITETEKLDFSNLGKTFYASGQQGERHVNETSL